MSTVTDQHTDPAAPEVASATEASANGVANTPPDARATELPAPLTTALSLPSDFRFDAVEATPAAAPAPTPPLGPLAHFKGTFTGNGFNTIFRPDSEVTPTPLPIPAGPSDNILELNLTHETLSFYSGLGSVPNRGSGVVQGDAFLNGVPYLQTISDVTTGRPIGIHFEPGLWIIVPPTKDPLEGSTLVRMASIPHGTTINAQGTFKQHNGPPAIGKVDITPSIEGTPSLIRFASQTATATDTPRIPQDLTAFIAAGTITQTILDDPNEVLRNAIHALDITHTSVISIKTRPQLPLFGGGTDNIAFLWGDAAAVTSANPSGQNAQAAEMTATFWIETVQRTLTVDPFKPGQHTVTIKPPPTAKGQPVPSFLVRPPRPITAPTHIKVTYPQIQYTQTVVLNFAGLTWPHVSVATLVPASRIPVPASAFP